MVYTMAAIWEMLRWRPISPMGLPRGTSEDVIIGGFTIPEGTIVMANLWAVNMDSSLWVHPEKFDPYRFIEEGRAKLKPKPEYFIPFSLGKRMCPAEAVSPVEVFLYLTGILQQFTVLPEEGAAIDLSMDCVTFNLAKPQKLRFLPREQVNY
ncbi:cytochrome P450 2U1 [Ixodes scapularis]